MFNYKKFWKDNDWNPDKIPAGKEFNKIKKYIKGKSVLDVGCGQGRMRHLFDSEYFGVDINDNTPDDCVTEDILEFYTDREFDVVFTCVTLQHIPAEHIQDLFEKMGTWGKEFVFIESTGGEMYCHNHDYEKLFDVKKKIEISEGTYAYIGKPFKDTEPIISVVMPTYNREEFLAESIGSILNQSYRNFELVIIDDGSTDDTKMLIDHFNDRRIKYFLNKKNMGIAKSRNRGTKESVGKYIAVMDSDDIMSPDRLKKSINMIEKGYDVVYSPYLTSNENGKAHGVVDPLNKLTYEDLLNDQIVPHVTILAKREVFENTPYREEYTCNDDLPLIFDWFLADYKFKKINYPVMSVRFHGGSVSQVKLQLLEDLKQKAIKDFKEEYANK